MNNAFPPPPPPPSEGVEIASVTNDHGPPWPKLKLLKLPLWAWITAGVLGLGAVGVAAAPRVDNATSAGSLETSAATAPESLVTVASSVPATTAPTVAATVAPTVAATVAPTVPPTVAPTIPATVAPTVPPTVAPTVPPTSAPTVPPTIRPAASLPAPPVNDCDPNYTPCVPIDSDVDCAGGSGNGPSYVQGPVRVIGSDIYGLDGNDNDGIGCE